MITRSRKMIQRGPWTPISDLNRRPEDSVEIDIILAHELVKAHIFLVEPPLFPLRRVIGGDTRVSYGCIKLAQNGYIPFS